MIANNIGPFTVLPKGTRVQIRTKRGTVVSHFTADNGVVVHTVTVTEVFKRFGTQYRWIPCTPKTWSGNYSFVQELPA